MNAQPITLAPNLNLAPPLGPEGLRAGLGEEQTDGAQPKFRLAPFPWFGGKRQIAAEAGKGMPAPMPDNWVATQAPSLVLPVEDVEPPSTYAVRAAQRAGEAAGGRPSAPDS